MTCAVLCRSEIATFLLEGYLLKTIAGKGCPGVMRAMLIFCYQFPYYRRTQSRITENENGAKEPRSLILRARARH